jgi:hypothetical protein
LKALHSSGFSPVKILLMRDDGSYDEVRPIES